MRSKRATWLSGLGAVVVSGGLLVAGVGLSGGQAAAAVNPFTEILAKLEQILTAIGGIKEGNHTLRWDTNNPSASRFVTAFTGAVLDKNTGLVWEQAPDTTRRSWFDAASYCVNKDVGGTRGWRLPSVAELTSLIDPSLAAPFVPASVFTGVQSDAYWSASTVYVTPTFAWDVLFLTANNIDGYVGNVLKTVNNADYAWCVRGGGPLSEY